MRVRWLLSCAALGALTACLDIAASDEPEAGVDASGLGGAPSSGGWPGQAGAGGGAGAGGSAGTASDSGAKVPFDVSDFSAEHSGDSAPNATSISFTASIPLSTRLLVACRHARDNDTKAEYPGTMTVGGQSMLAIDPAATGVLNDNQAGVHCFHLDDPPTGTQSVKFTLLSGSFDYMRLSTFYFARPAVILDHATSVHSSSSQHSQSIFTSEPAVVLVVYTKYYQHLPATTGFLELFKQAGFGGDAVQYAAALVQSTPGAANWSVSWSGSASWGGSQLLAVAPK